MKRLLACLLMLTVLGAPAAAEETVSFSIPSAYGSRSASVPLETGWFSWESRYYNHGLARLSLGMAVSAFRGSKGSEDAAIRAFFQALSFVDAETAEYRSPSDSSVSTAMAWRSVDGVPVIAVAMGGGENAWQENLDLGAGNVHQGFFTAAETAAARIRDYAARHQLQNAKYWLAGYGRGGAVLNLAAGLLIRNGHLSQERLYAYTFASPRVTQSAAAYASLFNIVSPADALAQLPPAAWGYGRNGKTLALPSSRRADYHKLASGYFSVLRQFTGQDAVPDLSPMVDAAVREAASRIGSRENYLRSYQQALYKLFAKKTMNAAETIRVTALLSFVSRAARQANPGTAALAGNSIFSSPELSALYWQHDPAVYAAWMLSLPDGNVFFDQNSALTEGT